MEGQNGEKSLVFKNTCGQGLNDLYTKFTPRHRIKGTYRESTSNYKNTLCLSNEL